MKRFISLFLGMCLLLALVACGQTASSSTPATVPSTGSSSSEPAIGGDKAALPTYKILFTYGNFADVTGSQFKSSMEYLAKDMNVEFTFLEGGYGEEAVAALEAAVTGGDFDGIIIVEAATPALLTAAQGVPLISACSSPASEEAATEVATYENFLGSVLNGDYAAGYEAAEALYDAGCRNVCFAGLTQGMSKAHDDRRAGFMDFLNEKDDMKLLGEDYSRGQAAQAVSSFAAAFPEMDGIFASSGNGVLTAMQTEGLVGSVKAAIFDISEETGDFFDNGTLVYCVGGAYTAAMASFAVLYNYLADGTRVIEDSSVALERSGIYLRNKEDYDNYIKYVAGDIPVFTANEIKAMIHYYNEDISSANFAELSASPLEDVVARHESIVG